MIVYFWNSDMEDIAIYSKNFMYVIDRIDYSPLNMQNSKVIFNPISNMRLAKQYLSFSECNYILF